MERRDFLLGAALALKTASASGASDLHCEPQTPGLRGQRCFDWLDTTISVD